MMRRRFEEARHFFIKSHGKGDLSSVLAALEYAGMWRGPHKTGVANHGLIVSTSLSGELFS